MKKHGVAILGFGVVGGGVADLLTNNREEIKNYLGCEVEIRKILDLRDFPDSPFADLVTHSFDEVIADDGVDTVMEMMGGSHPAYEYTVRALKAGKNVITSNKEVVANFGDEFVAIAKEMGVSYRFEAAVGGGIPVISPMISCIGQNKITEVRGILNGTTNYILTKMFSFGAGFEESLKDAQERGYAERNPDADILGTDACRKIAILSSLANGKLVPTNEIHTEGITCIRKADVVAADKLGMSIKLLGRSIMTDAGTYIMVAPFMIGKESPLASVSGVYNAIEVLGDPIGSVMFYGPGAGAGATASAVVSDLMQIMCSGRKCAQPTMIKSMDGVIDFADFESQQYVAVCGANAEKITAALGDVQIINESDEISFITQKMREGDIVDKLEGFDVKSRIRLI